MLQADGTVKCNGPLGLFLVKELYRSSTARLLLYICKM